MGKKYLWSSSRRCWNYSSGNRIPDLCIRNEQLQRQVADVNERQAMYTKLSEIDQKARQDYIGQIDETKLTDGICAGYVAGLGDLQAQYMSAEKYKTYQSGTAGKDVGVGIKTIMDEDGNMEVIQVIPNSPAEKRWDSQGRYHCFHGWEEIVGSHMEMH